MSPILSTWLQLALLVTTLVVTVIHIDKRIDDLKSEMNHRFDAIDKRIDDLKDWVRSEMRRIEERISPVIK